MSSIEIDLAEHLDGCQSALEDDGRLVFVDESHLIDYAKSTLEMIEATDKDGIEKQAQEWFHVFEGDDELIKYAVEELGLIDNSDKKTITIKLNTDHKGKTTLLEDDKTLICNCGGVLEARTNNGGVTTIWCRLCHDKLDMGDLLGRLMKR